MKRVTLTIEDSDKGSTERYAAEGESRWALALVFRTVNAAIGAHPEEISALTEAARLISSMVSACAGPGSVPLPSPSEEAP